MAPKIANSPKAVLKTTKSLSLENQCSKVTFSSFHTVLRVFQKTYAVVTKYFNIQSSERRFLWKTFFYYSEAGKYFYCFWIYLTFSFVQVHKGHWRSIHLCWIYCLRMYEKRQNILYPKQKQQDNLKGYDYRVSFIHRRSIAALKSDIVSQFGKRSWNLAVNSSNPST